ncbi:MAG: NAD(P)-dependent oxidoreductase, partial [Hyphomicrobiales bacterium]|nr:NAD(P)-dependent oxidoreductase [Hyphomicrobiales bacterium]
MNTLLAAGLGFSAKEIAPRLKAQGWRIIGTSRNVEGVAAIEALDYEAALFTGDAPSADLKDAISATTHLLLSAPPIAEGDPLLVHHAEDLANAPNLEWVGYLSTIGVYGDT